jgi:thiol-disulfide isomerase/thioredoxin
MSIKYIFPIFAMLTLSYGCSQPAIKGHIDLDGQKIHPVIYLIDPVNFGALVSSFEGKVIDSALVDNRGDFQFDKINTSGQQTKMYVLVTQQRQETYPNKLVNDNPKSGNYIPFIYEAGKPIEIQSNSTHFLANASIIGGNPSNSEIVSLIQNRIQFYEQYLSNFTETDEENLVAYEKAVYDYQNALVQSVTSSNNIFLHALALRWASIEGDYERIPELVKQECTTMQKLEASHLWTAQVCQKLTTLPLTKGDTIPDFLMPMVSGDTIRLAALYGTKLTLIDLWASWCAPCRMENRTTLVPLWDKYHKQGLQIIGYALDSSHKGWENAIIKDGADRWKHASHLQGDVSPFLDKLKVTTIPANYIIDPHGVILAKNLHGEALEAWVEAFYKN